MPMPATSATITATGLPALMRCVGIFFRPVGFGGFVGGLLLAAG